MAGAIGTGHLLQRSNDFVAELQQWNLHSLHCLDFVLGHSLRQFHQLLDPSQVQDHHESLPQYSARFGLGFPSIRFEMCSRDPHHGVSRPRCSTTPYGTCCVANALSFSSAILSQTRVRWKYDQVHTTLQRRKGLKTVSSLCTTEVQVVRWSMDQLWCHTSHTHPRRERVRSSPCYKHSQRLSKALLIVCGHVFVSCDTSLSDPLCK